jgi:hypothetical protein
VIDGLERELAALGVPARRRHRIRLELEDHLACDPGAELGDPAALARQFADELGTTYARRAAFACFLALAPLGLLSGVAVGVGNSSSQAIGAPVTLALVLGVQLAFVGGMLALLRAWRLRRSAVVPAREATVLARRAALGLAGGLLTVAGLAGAAAQSTAGLRWLAIAAAATGAVTLACGSVVLLRSLRIRPVAEGVPGDLSFDLGVDVDPWRIALVIAGAVALCIAVAGVFQADPFDGLVRAVWDGMLCLGGFALLGRPLGLRA